MDTRDMLAYGTRNGVVRVLQIRKEDGVQLENISTIDLGEVFRHFRLSTEDTKVYCIEFVNNNSRLLVSTSHGMFSISTRNVHLDEDCVWTNMREEEEPGCKLVTNHDIGSVITSHGTYLDIWRITSTGRLSGPWQLSPTTEGEISCLATNIDQDLGLGRENGVVEWWHPGTTSRGPERTFHQQMEEGSMVLALALSNSLVCAVNSSDKMLMINQVEVLRTVNELGFVPVGFLFPQRDACQIEEVKSVVLVDITMAFPYDVHVGTWLDDIVEMIQLNERDSVTCCAQGRDDIYFGTARGVIKHSVFTDNGDLGPCNTLNLPHRDESICCITLSENVFESARERDWGLRYPDACGGEVRDWISSKGHGKVEMCATQQSLIRMKEDDFIERLMCRFDSKRFCRDCTRIVIREFKELKELKRIRREPCCTSWFCVADTSFQYEVSHDTVQADWHQALLDTFRTYHHFQWAVGSEEGKSDILEFENIGSSGRVQVNGLDLSGLNACYITLRAWKMDGCCTEISVKAHALKGKQCVHCRLVLNDGFVTINRGEGIGRFFEYAEESEEEEDDNSMDNDGNDLDGGCPQKHAKSPELAQEFLLAAATVIFKEQIGKAFREGTTRQNARSIFVSLALKILEEHVHVACKEIITLEKQMKLLEEEEKEKREEEELKERKTMQEEEKIARRKERLREMEKDKEKKFSQTDQHVAPDVTVEELTASVEKESKFTGNEDVIISETGDVMSPGSASPDIQDNQVLNGCRVSNIQGRSDGGFTTFKDESGSFGVEHSKCSRWKLKLRKAYQLEPKWSKRRRFSAVSESRSGNRKVEEKHKGDHFETSKTISGLNKQSRCNAAKTNPQTSGSKFADRLYCSNRVSDRYYCGNKHTKGNYMREGNGRSKTKFVAGNNHFSIESPHIKQVQEPMESHKKYVRSTSDSDVTLISSTYSIEATEPNRPYEWFGAISCDEFFGNAVSKYKETVKNCQNGFHFEVKPSASFADITYEYAGTSDPYMSSTSNCNSCSSCLSEGDSCGLFVNPSNPESSSNLDYVSQHSDGRETSPCLKNAFHKCQDVGMEKKQRADGVEHFNNKGQDSGENNEQVSFSLTSLQCTMAPHNNHHVFSSPFGYGINGNCDFMPYGDPLHMAPPSPNQASVLVYQPDLHINGVNSKDQPINKFDPGGVKEAQNRTNTQRVTKTVQDPMEAHPSPEGGPDRKPRNPEAGSAGFSLFHFGSPVALGNGCKSDPLSSKEAVGDHSPNVSAEHTVGVHNCNKDDAIEELRSVCC